MQIDDPDDQPIIFDALDAVARDPAFELDVTPDLPSQFDAHHHRRPPLDNGAERAAEIIAMQLTLAPANSRIVAAQELIEAQCKRIVSLEAALRAVHDSAGNAQRGTKLPTRRGAVEARSGLGLRAPR